LFKIPLSRKFHGEDIKSRDFNNQMQFRDQSIYGTLSFLLKERCWSRIRSNSGI